jgi:hypothetical protein
MTFESPRITEKIVIGKCPVVISAIVDTKYDIALTILYGHSFAVAKKTSISRLDHFHHAQ